MIDNMEKLSYLFLTISLMFCNGCDPLGTTNENNKEEKPETPSLTVDDISGVWVDPSNEWYYISIYPSGRYTYCLNEKLIGSGNYRLDGEKLTLNNNYTYSSDVIDVSVSNGKLTISGEVSDWKSQKTYIHLQFNMTNEQFSSSVIGSSLSCSGGLNKYYDKVKKEIKFISDVNFTYESIGLLKSTGKWKTLSDITFYYVYRNPYTYGLRIGGDDEVEIYVFGFTEKPGDSLSFDLSNFRVN